MNNEFFNDNAHESIMAKSYAVKSVVFQYTYPLTTRALPNEWGFIDNITEELYRFYEDALTGYFFQEYAGTLLEEEERKHTIEVLQAGSKTKCAGCGGMFGILAASKCGYKADDLLGLVQHYFGTFVEESTTDVCSRFTRKHSDKATKAMKKKSTKEKKKASAYEKCIEDLKLEL